jgi:Tol biopolymer transport system component
MGTAAYMSPEQVRGEKLDARTDLFSFGLILFEMATGQRAFDGETATIVHDAILHRALPPVKELNPELPDAFERIVGKALEKDRELRFQTAAEMLAELKTIGAVPTTSSAEALAAPGDSSLSDRRPASSRWTLRLATFIGGGFLLLLGGTGLLWRKYSRPSPRAEITERQLTTSSRDNPIVGAAISGDGKYLAYGDNFGLHVRSLESGETRDIPQPPELGDTHVYWSIRWFPDSTRFFAVSPAFANLHPTTWQASVTGGTLHKVRYDAEARSVSPDGTSVAMTMADEKTLLMRELWVMDTDGGNPQKLLDAGYLGVLESVQWSPDGTKLLYIKRDEHGATIEIRDVKGRASHVVLSDPQLRDLYWLRDGRVVYVIANPGVAETCDYWAARIDEKTNAFVSKPVQLTHNRGFCVGDTSATADSKRLVFTEQSLEGGVYVSDVEAGGTRNTVPRELTLTEGVNSPNGWTADGREVVFMSDRDEKWGIYRQPLDGGAARPILLAKTAQRPDWGFPRPSPDGEWLLIEHMSRPTDPGIHNDLYRVPMTGGQEELIAQDIFLEPSCAAPSVGLCAYSKIEKNQLIFTSFDSQLKQRYEIGRSSFPDPKGGYDWKLSPDATKIAIFEMLTDNIYLLDLKTQSLKHIVVKHWSKLFTMDWTADGKGLFMSVLQPSCVLLHVDLHGNVQVLWEQLGGYLVFALPSPDGKHVAMPLDLQHANVWMMENF